MARDIDTSKFTLSYLIKLVEGVVYWQLSLEKCIVLCTREAKLIASIEASKELI